jgi:hypothetical protein
MAAFKYQCLVWPAQMSGFGLVDAKFSYPVSTSKIGLKVEHRI